MDESEIERANDSEPAASGEAQETREARQTQQNQEAQRAADGLKGQIAAIRDQVRQARRDLMREPKRKGETRSFDE